MFEGLLLLSNFASILASPPSDLTRFFYYRNKSGEAQQTTPTFNPQASISLLSVGSSIRKFIIEPFQSKTLDIRSVVTRPGTYCMGAFFLKVRRDPEAEWVPQSCHHLQSTVLVRTEAPTAMDRHLASELASIHSISSSAAQS